MTNYISNSNSFLTSKSIKTNSFSKGTSRFLSSNKNKYMYDSSKLDSICLPSPKLNKRYRFSILPTVKCQIQHYSKYFSFSFFINNINSLLFFFSIFLFIN